MKLQKLLSALRHLVSTAAGKDGALTRTEASKLPKFIKDTLEAMRSGGQKVELEPVLSAIRYAGPDGQSQGLEGLWIKAQLDSNGVAKGPSDLSLAERERITPQSAKDLTLALWTAAENAAPELRGVRMVDLKVSQLKASVKLLQELVRRSDNGDGLIRDVELQKAKFTYQGTPDPATTQLLVTASNRAQNKGNPLVEGVVEELELALKELLAGNTDGNQTLSAAELAAKHTLLGEYLAIFAVQHKGDTLSDFSFEPEKIYVPTRPFKAPAGANAAGYLDALIKHFNAFSNDNKMPGSTVPTRYVMGEVEATGVAKEIGKLSATKGKAVLRVLEERVAVSGHLHDPPGVYFTPAAVALLDAQAARLGISCDFVGSASPPSFDFY